MFSGIIEEVVKVTDLKQVSEGIDLTVSKPSNSEDVVLGESIALNGVCLTVSQIDNDNLHFQLAPETVNRSNFKNLKNNDLLNLERSLKLGDRISGHFVFGHVDQTIKCLDVIQEGESFRIFFELQENIRTLVVEKGSISINGVSLTIASIEQDRFSVVIIPHTWQNTNLRNITAGTLVNIEVDMLARYIKAQSK